MKYLFEYLAADYLLAHFFYIANSFKHRLSLQKRQASSKFTSASIPKPSSGHETGNIRTYYNNSRNSAPFTHRNFNFFSLGGFI